MDYYVVRAGRSEDHCRVYARVHAHRYSTGIAVLRSEWDQYKAGTFDSHAQMQSTGVSYGTFADALQHIRVYLEQPFRPNEVRAAIGHIRQSAFCHAAYLDDYMGQYLHELRTGQRLKRKSALPLSTSHVSVIAAVRNNVVRFENAIGGRIRLDDVNMDFQRRYVEWNLGRGLSANTMNDYMNIVRLVMQAAYDSGLTRNAEFRQPGFVPDSEEVDNVYLTTSQVEEMRLLDLATPGIREQVKSIRMRDHGSSRLPERQLGILMEQLAITRDIFVAGCLTGQRRSDYARLSRAMITTMAGRRFVCLTQRKTRKKVYIPLDYRVMEILERYEGALPYQSRNIFNRNVRIIGELLGWTWTVEQNGKMCRFCECLSSHTARRSFATNAFTAGIPLSSIMAVTGHSREEHLRRYLRLDVEERGRLAAKDLEGFMNLGTKHSPPERE